MSEKKIDKETVEQLKNLFNEHGFEFPDVDLDEEDEDEVEVDFPELRIPPPELPKGPLTEEWIKRDVERKYKRMERKVKSMFDPPGQTLYATNQIFRDTFDECDQAFQQLEREEGREPVSLVDVMFPWRHATEEDIKEF